MEKLLPAIMLSFLTLSPSLVLAAPPANQSIQPASDFKAKLLLGENYRDQGNYPLAAKQFATVLVQAEKTGDKLTQAMAAAALGHNYYLARNNAKAQPLLERARNLVKPLNAPDLAALIDDYLGLLYLSLQQPEQAALSFNNALKNAQLTHNNALILGIQVNQAELEADAASRLQLLENISTAVLKLNEAPIKIKLLLAIGEQLVAMSSDDLTNAQLLKASYQVLNNAYQLADANHQIRLRSQAEGYLGRLYAAQNRHQDALRWLDKAIFDAQQVHATDLLMRWEMQSGKVFQATANNAAAMQAYTHAVQHLTDIRYSVPATLHNGHSSVKDIIDPIYRGLADTLLLQAANTASSEAKQLLLRQAIDAMETIKQSELEEFFNDRCLVGDDTIINLKDALLPEIGIIYPIILPDRVELLFRAGESSQFEQKSIAVSSKEVTGAAAEMAQYLRDGQGNYRPAARKLYNWLFKAYDSTLKAKGITTVVYLPDGFLRQIPFAALLNDKKFAIEDYAIVTLPRLTLKKPVARDQHPHALIAALSKPDGASIDELLQSPVGGVLGERGITELPEITVQGEAPKMTRALLVEKLSLPSINTEVSDIQKNTVNTTLLNQTFTVGEFKESLETGNYSIIHVASHGYFGKNAADSFVMTYDRNLKLSEFESLLSDKRIKKNSIDLLTLSACQTAEGDDHALLGFSGMAIKTNARSAIGTLWPVSDVATATLMKDFYANLNTQPKALALQQAQLALLKNNDTKHPYYWSPFVLVGNW